MKEKKSKSLLSIFFKPAEMESGRKRKKREEEGREEEEREKKKKRRKFWNCYETGNKVCQQNKNSLLLSSNFLQKRKEERTREKEEGEERTREKEEEKKEKGRQARTRG